MAQRPIRPLPLRTEAVLLPLLGAMACAQEEHFFPEHFAVTEPPTLFEATVTPQRLDARSVHELAEMLAAGQGLACCGHWRDEAAGHFQERVAAELGAPLRHLGDVHLANASAHVHSSGSGGWGASAVLYLDEPEDAAGAQVTLASLGEGGGGELAGAMAAPQGAIILVPDGGQLLHASPRRVAFLRVRRGGPGGEAGAGRSAFEYYVASWVRKNFVTPYDTGAQRHFFSAHTKYPRYWHGFLSSFLGMFCTVFACFPLAWWGMQLAELMMKPDPEPPSEAADAVINVPGTPTKPPTLLPRLGPEARNLPHLQYVHKPGGNRLLPFDAEKSINLNSSLLYRSC